jgi:branched-chain amino acid transport system ATP-binding protein
MLFEINRLDAYYGKARALTDISLHVEEGEVVTVIGANGAGKTTLLRIISGLKRASEGEILFEGKRIDHVAPNRIARRGIIQVPAGREIVATMTVLENLKLGAGVRRRNDSFAEDLKEMYKLFPILEERKSQAGGELSGGQQQMLALARALMARPRLLLMDEPSTGLAPLMVAEVGNQIRDVSQRLGVSILLVEQNARMALSLADRAYVLELGRVVLSGPAADLACDERVQCSYLGGSV